MASFVVPPTGECLFVGCYESHGWKPASHNEHGVPYDHLEQAVTRSFQRLEAFEPWVGRLVIDWGSGTRAVLQYADRHNKPIVEIRKAFAEPPFPGYSRFVWEIGSLPTLPASWQTALASVRGVYLLTSP
ncbi:MAG: GIY-YIG nuclease family protein, partial [Pseudomonadota bacterium]